MKLKRSLALVMATVFMLTSVDLTGNTAFAAGFSAEESFSDILTEESVESGIDEALDEDILLEDDSQISEDEPEDESAYETADSFENQEAVSEEYDESEQTYDMEVSNENTSFETEETEEEPLGVNVINRLDANGGVFPNGEQVMKLASIANGSYFDYDIYKPVRNGKLFKGWYADKECTELLSSSDDPLNKSIYYLKKMPEQGITLYAGWVDYYTLTYVFGNDDGTDPVKDTGYFLDVSDYANYKRLKSVQFKIPVGTNIKNSVIPDKFKIRNSDFHYEYNYHWYRDEERTQMVDSLGSEVPTEDTTYYAGYSDKYYTVTYHSIDKTGYFTSELYYWTEDGYENRYETMTVQIEKRNKAFMVSGYEFQGMGYAIRNTDARRAIAGYCADENGTDLDVSSGGYVDINGDMDVYVKWESTNKVLTFVAGDNGNGFIAAKTPITDMSVKKVEVGVAEGITSAYLEVGYVKNTDLHKRFAGWATSKNATTPEIKVVGDTGDASNNYDIPDKEVTYYAVWEDVYKIVELDAGEGTFTCHDPLTIKEHKNVSKITTRTISSGKLNYYPLSVEPNDPNKIFVGWSDGTNLIKDFRNQTFTKDTTLKAVYAPSYTITLDGNGGRFNVYDKRTGSNVQYVDVKNATLKTKENGTINGTVYTPEYPDNTKVFAGWYIGTEKVSSLSSYVFKENTTVKAVYVPVYTVTIKGNGGTFKYSDSVGNKSEDNATEAVLYTGADGKIRGYVYTPKCSDESKGFSGWYVGDTEISNLNSYVFTGNTEVVARYGAVYTITFKGNGGTFNYSNREDDSSGTDVTEVTLKTGTNGKIRGSVTSAKPGSADKLFKGWYIGSEKISNVNKYVFTSDAVVEAKFADVYTITIDGNGGVFDYNDYNDSNSYEGVAKAEIKTGSDGTLNAVVKAPTINDPSKIFDAWYDGETRIEYFYDHVFTGATTVKAHYKNAFTVTLDADGGYFGADESQTTDQVKIAEGATAHLATPVHKDPDKRFGGWYKDKDIWNEPIGGNYYVPTKSETIYAKWVHCYEVVFDCGEGSINGENKAVFYITEGTTFGMENQVPSDPESGIEGRVFAGWYKDRALTEKVDKYEILSTVIAKKTTFYAKYARSCTVTFDANGGQFVGNNESLMTVKAIEGEKLKGKYPSAKSTEKKTFRGWFTSKDCKDSELIENIYDYVPNGDVTLYAGYTECYLITFKANQEGAKLDGKTGDVVVKVVKGEAFRFAGENENKDALFSSPKVTADGVTDMSPMVIIDTAGEPTYGWSEKPDGTGNIYYFGRSDHFYEDEEGNIHYINSYGFVPTSDMTFYAVWGKTVTVSFNANGGKFKDYYVENRFSTFVSEDIRTIKVASGTRYRNIHEPIGHNGEYMTPKEGMNICLWGYTDAEATNYFGDNNKITEDTTIFAKWNKANGAGSSEDDYETLTLHAGKGHFGNSSSTTFKVEYKLGVNSTHIINVPVIDSQTEAFSCWYKDEALTDPYPAEYQYTGGDYKDTYFSMPQKIENLYAGYGVAYTITFDANGGYFDKDESRTKDPQAIKDDATIKAKQNIVGAPVCVSDYTKRVRRDGDKVFAGWYTDKELTKKAEVFSNSRFWEYYTPTENVTFYAKWVSYSKPTIKVNTADITLGVNDTKQLFATVTPKDQEANIHWYISDYTNKVYVQVNKSYPVTITTDGLVTANSLGTAKVYAELNGVQSDIITIIVKEKGEETDEDEVKDWGDIDESTRKNCFGDDFDSVPEGVWYLIDGKKYDTRSATSLTATYNGAPVVFNEKIAVFHHARKLSENRDYTLTYTNNVNAAAAAAAKAPTVTVKGKGTYSIEAPFTFTIEAEDINNAHLTSEKKVSVVAGKTKLSAVKTDLSYNGKKLVLSKDYSVKYFDGATEVDPNKVVLNDASVGKIYTVKISGLGNFAKEFAETVTVETLKNDKAHIAAVSSLKVVNDKKKAITFEYKEGTSVNIAKEFEDKNAVVYDGKTPLTYGVDYVILEGDSDNSSAGKHSFVVEGIKKDDADKKSYIGQKLCTYEIKGTAMSKVKVAGMKTATDFTGSKITLSDLYNSADKNLKGTWKSGEVPVLYAGTKGAETALINGKDYTVSMTNTGAVGKINLVFTGMGGYTGTLKKTVTVKACKLSADKLVIKVNGAADNKGVADFVKSGSKPDVEVYVAGSDRLLVQGADYTVSYKNNAKVGKSSDGKKAPTVLVKGIGNYAGTSASASFTIKEASVKQISVVTKDVVFKTGKSGYWRTAPKLMDDGKAVTVGKNKDVELVLYGKDKFEYRYLEATKVKTKGGKGEEITRAAGSIAEKDDVILSAGATIKVTAKVICTAGKSNYFTNGESEEISGYFRIAAADITKAKISMQQASKSKLVAYYGETVDITKDDLVVTLGSKTLSSDEYDIVSITGNKAPGSMIVTIRGKGNYGGTKSQTFKLTLKKS